MNTESHVQNFTRVSGTRSDGCAWPGVLKSTMVFALMWKTGARSIFRDAPNQRKNHILKVECHWDAGCGSLLRTDIASRSHQDVAEVIKGCLNLSKVHYVLKSFFRLTLRVSSDLKG